MSDIDLSNLNPVEYNDYACSYNVKAVCPYCGYENDIYNDYGSQDDWQEDCCGNCDRDFVRQTDYVIHFSTMPIENYIIDEIKNIQHDIKYAEEQIEKGKNVEYQKQYLEIFNYRLEKAKEKYLRLIEDNKDYD